MLLMSMTEQLRRSQSRVGRQPCVSGGRAPTWTWAWACGMWLRVHASEAREAGGSGRGDVRATGGGEANGDPRGRGEAGGLGAVEAVVEPEVVGAREDQHELAGPLRAREREPGARGHARSHEMARQRGHEAWAMCRGVGRMHPRGGE